MGMSWWISRRINWVKFGIIHYICWVVSDFASRYKLTRSLQHDVGPLTWARHFHLHAKIAYNSRHSGGVEIARSKIVDDRQFLAAIIVSIICKRRGKERWRKCGERRVGKEMAYEENRARGLKAVVGRVTRRMGTETFQSTTLQRDTNLSHIIFLVPSSENVVFTCVLHGNLPTTTSSATLTEENFFLHPLSRNCH